MKIKWIWKNLFYQDYVIFPTKTCNCRILFCVSLDQSVKAQILQSLLQNNGSSANTEESPSTSNKESAVTLTNTRPTSPNSSLDGTQIWNWKPAEEDLLVSIRHEKTTCFWKAKITLLNGRKFLINWMRYYSVVSLLNRQWISITVFRRNGRKL